MSLAWGGYANGRISGIAMHVIPNFAPLYAGVDAAHASNMMMTEAAVQFSGFAHAFYLRFGKPLNVSEAYRRLDRQQTLYKNYKEGKGNLAAYPGTSNHGWGRSLDLASGVNVNGSAENVWARQNGPSYGFYFTVPSEAWHVDYIGSPRTRVSSYIANPNTRGSASSGTSGATPATVSQQQWLATARGEKLKADGVRGPATIAAIKRYQEFLKKNYGYSGAIDGVWGPKVQTAHSKYYSARKKDDVSNATIKSRQTWLNDARGEKLKVDGIDGAAFKAAVKRYETFLKQKYGYTGAIDGVWGSGVQTAHRKYYDYTRKPKAVRPMIKQGSSGAYVRTLQKHLGLKQDGEFGPATKAAVIKLQKSKKLTPDGIVGTKTWAALGL